MRINFESARSLAILGIASRRKGGGWRTCTGHDSHYYCAYCVVESERASERARVCACALCFLRLGTSDLCSARDIMHAAIYARRRAQKSSQQGRLRHERKTEQLASSTQATRCCSQLRSTLYTTTRVLFMHAAAKTFAF
jgi:hypothetical protein